MVRTKQAGKRTRVDSDAPPAPPRLSQMPVKSWYYPRFVAAAYITVSIFDTLRADGTGDFRFRFKLGGREYILTLQHLADIWGLQNEGATFKSGNNPHGTWNEFDKMEA
ncbi:hypothetical protein PIB30_113222, partial [Stylosanthes scabra]|nr:hypothetical protein [Stylosanthes scabra]